MEIKEYVKFRKEYLKQEINKCDKIPHLVIIQVNNDEASNAYVRGKIKDLTEIEARYTHDLLPIDTSEAALVDLIDKYNQDDDVDGILVQMPLPKHISEQLIKEVIIPSKDVDGFHPMSKLIPCTPKGIIDYLKHEQVDFRGKNAVVIGRSNIVGRPVAKLLLDLDANVTILHSKTSKLDLENYLKNADIVVCAVGKKWFISEQELKPTAIVVDVGINRVDKKLYGDCAPGLNVTMQTPVPGGVGLLTRISMLENLLECYKLRKRS